MNKKTITLSLILFSSLGINHTTMAQSGGSACNITVTNNYNSTSSRTVYVYLGTDTVMSSSYQSTRIEYGDTAEYNCGTNQENCKIRWEYGSARGMISEWLYGHETVECDANFIITTETS